MRINITRRIEMREKALELFDAGVDYKAFKENGLQNSWYYSIKNDRKKFEVQLEELKNMKESLRKPMRSRRTILLIQTKQNRTNCRDSIAT